MVPRKEMNVRIDKINEAENCLNSSDHDHFSIMNRLFKIIFKLQSQSLLKFSLLVNCLVLNLEQIGSRITSKRISQMVEECFPCSYIMVDNHPCRYDPSHFVTHRIQSTVMQFADCLLQVQVPHSSSEWCSYLRAFEMMVCDLNP